MNQWMKSAAITTTNNYNNKKTLEKVPVKSKNDNKYALQNIKYI
jgi:hypothetical protein